VSSAEATSNWKDWVFEESRRRLSAVFRVINLLVSLDPAAACEVPYQLFIAPLPAKKQLWEAADQGQWVLARDAMGDESGVFGLTGSGELVRLNNGNRTKDLAAIKRSTFASDKASQSAANWEEWCTGIDGFGALIMLAASLLQ
jgi:hypothetical protein